MSYYKVLGLKIEPFSTSPDPAFFYESSGHKQALNNLLIELKLRRGISVILGDIGTGKTTLSRKLIKSLLIREEFIFHIILDPVYQNKRAFLEALVQTLDIKISSKTTVSESQLEGTIKDFLFQQGAKENKTVVLIIDEAQKLSETSLEVLRILLNYETNTGKLLQLVVLGQLELYPKLVNMPNLIDRVSFKHILSPLNPEETRKMIEFRLRQAGYQGLKNLFTEDAVKKIHRYSQGYPRQIALLCHNALTNIVMNYKKVVDKKIIKKIRAETKEEWSLAGKTSRPVAAVPAEKSKIKSGQPWGYSILLLLLVLMSGVIIWGVLNYLPLKESARVPYTPPESQIELIESFYKTTVEQLKEEQNRTSKLIAELTKSRGTQQSFAFNEELFKRIKELETTRERVMTAMEEIAQTQSQVSKDNKELTTRLARLKDDFAALDNKLSDLPPALAKTRVVIEQEPPAGSYIISIIDAVITSDDWRDNDPGTKSAPPDCLVVVYQNDTSIFKSKIELDTHTPKWNDEFSLNWKKGDRLKVVIYDVDAKENEKMLGWDNGKDKEFLFKGKHLGSPNGSYLNYEVFTVPIKKEGD